MFFLKEGFLGAKAPLFLDLVTIYFAILPILFGISILFAVKKMYKIHFISQSTLLATTVIFVIFFEIYIRMIGGFTELTKDETGLYFYFLISILSIHIIIAFLTVLCWFYLYITTYRIYKQEGIKAIEIKRHRKIGKLVFDGLITSCYMGVMIYILIFLA
ncbi:DUF420 domain-containing protein [Halarcobacter ebronensis]|uniref:DUF420 domain-containing protein n=1 Tax=Halarcobacter ebronensis TaxID=1462615 RepID=A0A4Q1AX93_9BACT|nr:DUF420 domain-containing protein [Halarcobacter ebronensis]QKF81641.1 DUF420 domain-containing membrane protein [Halarcobacter ebronensis]RXK05565.1 hypothetical protein CRV07_08640 [Halarcobacter ebronensis]